MITSATSIFPLGVADSRLRLDNAQEYLVIFIRIFNPSGCPALFLRLFSWLLFPVSPLISVSEVSQSGSVQLPASLFLSDVRFQQRTGQMLAFTVCV